MKIISWNVNSIKARLEHVKNYVLAQKPDFLFMQELKGVDFPSDQFTALGYHATVKSQKTYNGVAILSPHENVELVLDELPGDKEDEQARYLEIEYKGLRLINIYLPNGNPVDTEKFTYKLSWMERLYQRLSELRQSRIPFLIGGDFNIIPFDEDCHDPEAWAGDALFHEKSLEQFRKYINIGLYDAFRMFNRDAEQYSFWDYQAGAWPQNKGIRIDHFLLSPTLANAARSCVIDAEPRGLEKPSDHTPIILELDADKLALK